MAFNGCAQCRQLCLIGDVINDAFFFFILAPALSTHRTSVSTRSIFSRNQSKSTSGRNANTKMSTDSGPTVTGSLPPLPPVPNLRQQNPRSSRASIAESMTSSTSLASSATVTGGANGIRLLTMHYMEESVLTQCVDQYEVSFTYPAPSLSSCHNWKLTGDHRKSKTPLANYSISLQLSRYSSK
jgi:hypothetical protein